VAQQVADVVEIVELLAETHRRALHGEQIVRLGSEDAEVLELEVGREVAARAQEALDGVVQPGVGYARPGCHASRRSADHLRRLEECIDVARRRARIEHEAHDRTAHHVELSDGVLLRELGVEEPQESLDVGLAELCHGDLTRDRPGSSRRRCCAA
jgi:hypothetical protein